MPAARSSPLPSPETGVMSDYTALAGPSLRLGRLVNGMTRALVGLGSSAILAVQATHASRMHDANSAVAIPAKKRTMAFVSVTSFVQHWYRWQEKILRLQHKSSLQRSVISRSAAK
jgi:hypothetical protein